MSKTLEIPEGFELDLENSSKDKIILKEIKYDWEDFGKVKGYYISADCRIEDATIPEEANDSNKNTYPSKEEAKAALAISQLLQWRNKTLGDWKPDFKSHEYYYAIVSHQYEIKIRHTNFIHHILTFETHTQAYEFMKNHKELLEQAKPLL